MKLSQKKKNYVVKFAQAKKLILPPTHNNIQNSGIQVVCNYKFAVWVTKEVWHKILLEKFFAKCHYLPFSVGGGKYGFHGKPKIHYVSHF